MLQVEQVANDSRYRGSGWYVLLEQQILQGNRDSRTVRSTGQHQILLLYDDQHKGQWHAKPLRAILCN
jgi:hypothetical protein